MALTACGPQLEYRVPPLNEADAERLTCSAYPAFEQVLRDLPAHDWLSTTRGEAVVTPDGRKWVAFDVVQRREALLLKFAGVDARGAHFECFDDLAWLASVWADLQAQDQRGNIRSD